MNKIIYYLFFLLSPFTSCVMDDNLLKVSTLMWDEDFDLAPRIPSEATELEVPFIFGTSADWNVVISDPLTKSHSWCSTPQDNGTRSYEITLHLIFEPNDTAEDRVVNVTVKTLFDSVLLVVTQSGSDDALTPEGQSITYNDSFALFQSVFADSKVLTPEFVFNATEAWSVECESEGDWISVSNANGEKGDLITLGLNFEENINEDEKGREGTITISTSKDEVMLTIKQHAKGVSIIPPLDFELTQFVESSATSLEPPFVFSVQEGWTVLVTTDVDGDIDAKDTGAGAEQWLRVDKTEGEAGDNIPLAITFDVNATDQREGRVTITTEGGSSVELTIIQLGETIEITYPDGFDIIQTVLSSATSLTPSFSFSVQNTWTVAVTPEGDDQWLTVEKQDGGEAGIDIAFPITFEANATDVERDGTVTITANSGHSVTLRIKQYGQDVGIIPPLDFELTQTVLSSATSLDPPFIFSVQEDWDVAVTVKEGDGEWLTIENMKGEAGNKIPLNISFTENTTDVTREGAVIITTAGNSKVTLIIKQLGKGFSYPADFLFTQTVPFDAGALDPEFEFRSSERWITTKESSTGNTNWFNVTNTTGDIGDDISFPITFEENTTSNDREATITIETISSYNKVEFIITQAAQPVIDSDIIYDDDIFNLTQMVGYDATALNPAFVFSVNDSWIATVKIDDGDDGWLSVSPASGNAVDEHTLPISFEENTTTLEREATIMLKSNDPRASAVIIRVIQAAEPVANITYNDDIFDLIQTVEYDATALNPAFVFSVYDSWTATVKIDGGDDGWLSVSPASGNAVDEHTLPISFEENTTTLEREATITLSTNDTRVKDVVITVTQEKQYTIPDGALRLTASGNLERDFTDQNFSTTITSLVIVGEALNEADWIFLDNIYNLTYLDIEGTITTTIYGNYGGSSIRKIETILLPSTLRIIEDGVFSYCSNLVNITIPSGVTAIGFRAFKNCSNLVNITIPSGVTVIEGEVFSGCSSLVVTIPASVTTIGKAAFRACSNLVNITIPAEVTVIENEVFSGCTLLERVTFASGSQLTTIRDYSFSSSGLTSITIPAEVTVIENEVFSDCTLLERVTFDANSQLKEIGVSAFVNCSNLNNIVIPYGLREIRNNLFENCTSLTSITIPNSVTTIWANIFKGCTNLISIDIPESVETIGDNAFYGWTGLENITIPSRVTTIGEAAFRGHTNLTRVTFASDSQLATIEKSCFAACVSLTDINIPEKVTIIDRYAFANCTALERINIPSRVDTIGAGAFRDCISLISLNIPARVSYIGSWAFAGSTSLTSITVNAIQPPPAPYASFERTNECPIYVPAGSVEEYKKAEHWNDPYYVKRIRPIP